jgi:AcrR family transcriptional regulator
VDLKGPPKASSSPTEPQREDQSKPPADARERIVRAAYDLFSRHGVRAIGVDRVVSEAGIAKTTLYRNFRSKDELVVAVLARREELWTHRWLEREVERRADAPATQLLAIFDAFDKWFRQPDFESCLFITTLLESHDPTGPVGAAAIEGLIDIYSLVRRLAEAAGVRDPDRFAHEWRLLMSGSIVSATAGYLDAAHRAQELGSLLLEREGISA